MSHVSGGEYNRGIGKLARVIAETLRGEPPRPVKFRSLVKAQEYARRLELDGLFWTITEVPGSGTISPHPAPRSAYDYWVVSAYRSLGLVRNPEVGVGEEE